MPPMEVSKAAPHIQESMHIPDICALILWMDDHPSSPEMMIPLQKPTKHCVNHSLKFESGAWHSAIHSTDSVPCASVISPEGPWPGYQLPDMCPHYATKEGVFIWDLGSPGFGDHLFDCSEAA